MATDPTGVRPLDRVDRSLGRQAPVDHRLLGQQTRPDVPSRGEARTEGRDRTSRTPSARRAGALDPPDRRRARPERHHGAPLAVSVRARHAAGAIFVAVRSEAERAPARVRRPRLGRIRAHRCRRPLSLRPVQWRSSQRSPAPCQGVARRGGGRWVCDLRLRPVRGRPPVSPRRPGGEVVFAQRARSRTIARKGTSGGCEMRPAVCKLSCRGRRKDRYYSSLRPCR